MATDIGICLGRIYKGRSKEWWKLQVQLPLLVSFFIGGVVGAWTHDAFHKFTLFINVALFGSIGILYVLVVAYDRNESFYDAMFGYDDLPEHSSGGRSAGSEGGDGEWNNENRV